MKESTLRMAARYLGAKGQAAQNGGSPAFAELSALLHTAAGQVLKAAQPQSRLLRLPVWVEGSAVELGALPRVESAQLARLMEKSRECLAVGLTLGREVDALARRRMLTQPALGAAIGAVASAYAEEALERVLEAPEKEYRAAGLALSPRFSPGYGDLPLEYQRPLCQALEMWRIGVTLTNACLMLPEKSITALLAVRRAGACAEKDRGEHACGRCGMTDCPYREEE